jgi:hypothetical protein
MEIVVREEDGKITWELTGWLYAVGALEKSLDAALICACISRPTTLSHLNRTIWKTTRL